jgi:hypothetical protein
MQLIGKKFFNKGGKYAVKEALVYDSFHDFLRGIFSRMRGDGYRPSLQGLGRPDPDVG